MAVPPSRLSSTIRFRPEAGRNALMQYIPNFRPEQAGNITLWLDASEYSTFTFRTPNNILTWADKKNPLQTFVLAGDGTLTPVYSATGFNGLPTVIFGQNKGLKNNTSKPYTLTSNDSLTIFLVGQLNTSPSQPKIMFRAAEMYSGTPIPLDIGADPTHIPQPFNWYGNFAVTFDFSAFSDSVSNTSPTVCCFNIPAGNTEQKLFLNATSTFIQSVGQRGSYSLNVEWDSIFIGTNGAPGIMETPWDGVISEVLVYDSSLSDSNCAKVAAYLGQKWGFKSSLTTPYDTQDVYKPVTSGPLFSLRNAQM